MASILDMIARPQDPNIAGRFQQGQQSALQNQLLQQQIQGMQRQGIDAQNQAMQQQQALAQRQGLLQSVGTPEYKSNLERLAVSQPEAAKNISQIFSGISKENQIQGLSAISLAQNTPIEEQNIRLEAAKQYFQGRPEFQNAISDIQNATPEQRVQMYQGIDALGQQLGVLEPRQQQTGEKFIKTVGNLAIMQGVDGKIKTVEVPGLDTVKDEDKEKALNVGSTVALKGGKIGRVVTDPKTGSTRIEVASVPEGAEVETQEQISQRKIDETEKKEAARLLSKERATIKNDILTSGRNADRDIIRLKRIKTALEFFETGKIAQAKKILGPYIPGIDPSDEQAMEALLQSAVFPVLANFKGPTTDFEFEKANETIARLGNTPRANALIVDSMIQFMNDKKDERNQFKKFVKGGGKPENFSFSPTSTPTVTTQQEFDALPSGSIYIEDGQTMRKP